jgi:hypothetical protein
MRETTNISARHSNKNNVNVKVLHLENSFVWWWNLDTSEIRSEVPGKFSKLVLEEDGEEQLGLSRQERAITERQEGKEYPTHSIEKED